MRIWQRCKEPYVIICNKIYRYQRGSESSAGYKQSPVNGFACDKDYFRSGGCVEEPQVTGPLSGIRREVDLRWYLRDPPDTQLRLEVTKTDI